MKTVLKIALWVILIAWILSGVLWLDNAILDCVRLNRDRIEQLEQALEGRK